MKYKKLEVWEQMKKNKTYLKKMLNKYSHNGIKKGVFKITLIGNGMDYWNIIIMKDGNYI